LIGAGNVGLEKLNSLLSNSPDAKITIVAPIIKEEVRSLLRGYPSCNIIQRPFQESDLENKDLIFLATDDSELHKEIKALAQRKKILANVADTPDLCDFYLSSIVQKGDLKIAISTNGKSPTIAKRLKEVLIDLIPDEMENILNNMSKIRDKIKGGFAEKVRQLNELTKSIAEK
jgi:siroheme synthase-like protein